MSSKQYHGNGIEFLDFFIKGGLRVVGPYVVFSALVSAAATSWKLKDAPGEEVIINSLLLFDLSYIQYVDFEILGLFVAGAFFYFAVVATFNSEYFSDHVSIGGAIAYKTFIIFLPYLGIGLAFSAIWAILGVSHKGSIHGQISNSVDAVYFSFSTMTTLGYGDISPVSNRAKLLAVVEAIVGVIYMALFAGVVIGTYFMRIEKVNKEPLLTEADSQLHTRNQSPIPQ